MRKAVFAVVVAGLLASMAWAQVVGAQSDTPSQAEFSAAIQRCIAESGGSPVLDGLPSVRYQNGEWHCIPPRRTISFGPYGLILGSIFLWSLLPMWIAVATAHARGESILVALLLTVLLGWIGLLVVLFGMRRSGQELRQSFGDGSVERASSSRERLQVLDELLRDGSITQDEYDQRRSEIISEI